MQPAGFACGHQLISVAMCMVTDASLDVMLLQAGFSLDDRICGEQGGIIAGRCV